MDDQAPPPSYDEVVKGRGMPGYNTPPEGFLPGPQGASPHTPAGYGQGVPSDPSAFPPPQHAQPLSDMLKREKKHFFKKYFELSHEWMERRLQAFERGSFPNYTYTITTVINQPKQHPSDQAGNATTITTAYQHPIEVSSGPVPQTGAPVSLNQGQQVRVFIIIVITIVIIYM